jgi:hypothetical protein
MGLAFQTTWLTKDGARLQYVTEARCEESIKREISSV